LPAAKIDGNDALRLPRGLAAGEQQGLTSRVGDNADQGPERSGKQIPQAFDLFFLKGFQGFEV
jgi:hypothetical protein